MGMALEKYKDTIIRMYVDEMRTTTEIAREIGFSQSSIERFLKANNVVIDPNRFKRLFNDEQSQHILELYNSGLTSVEIAQMYNTTDHTIAKVIVRMGGKMRQAARRSKINNHDYFETIDTPAKAYFLGWMITDGSVIHHKSRVNRTNTISIELQEGDKYIIDAFAKELEADENAVHIFEKRHHAHFRFASEKMSNDLEKYGVIPNKTYTAYIPDNIPIELRRHMLRGMFDGNGSFVFSNQYPQLVIYGTESICNSFRDIFYEELDIPKTSVMKVTCWRTSWGGFNTLKKVYSYFYDDCGEYYLKRKRLKIENALRYKQLLT